MSDLKTYRDQIDIIDNKMRELFEQRMDVVKKVGEYKLQNNLPILNSSRENEVIKKNCEKLVNSDLSSYYEKYLKSLMDISKTYQHNLTNNIKIGYQGILGSFSSKCANELYPNNQKQNYLTFSDVFEACQSGEIDYGIIPLENSTSGEVSEVIDLLRRYNCYIIKMYDLEVNQALLGVKGAKLSDIKYVCSHIQAYKQSKSFIKDKDLEFKEFANTAVAAKWVCDTNDKSYAAIGNSDNAKLYNLDIINEKINDSEFNSTRFIVISKNLQLDNNHFALTFVCKHEVGSLAKVMNFISSYGFNMERIVSHPLKNTPWNYYFYIELEGDKQKINDLLDNINEVTLQHKLIGCYDK